MLVPFPSISLSRPSSGREEEEDDDDEKKMRRRIRTVLVIGGSRFENKSEHFAALLLSRSVYPIYAWEGFLNPKIKRTNGLLKSAIWLSTESYCYRKARAELETERLNNTRSKSSNNFKTLLLFIAFNNSILEQCCCRWCSRRLHVRLAISY